jgi:hypothetical protein
MFVNSVAVWSRQTEANSTLVWNTADNMIIGKDLKSNTDQALIDNLLIRITNEESNISASLYNFNLETFDNIIRLHWRTTLNNDVDFFTVERSLNGTDFTKVNTVPSDSTMSSEEDYTYDDHPSMSGIVFYRIRQTFKNGHFVTYPSAAMKMKTPKS